MVAAVADDKSWEEVRDASVQGCTIFLQRNGDYGNGGAEEMCDGLMDLQGPHVSLYYCSLLLTCKVQILKYMISI